MKKTTLFLFLSLAANAAFAALFFLRPTVPASRAESASSSAEKSISSLPGKLTAAQLSALQSGDAAQLKAAGVTDEVARMLSVGRAYAALQSRMREMKKPADPDGKYWRATGSPFNFGNRTKEERAELAKIQREFADALRVAFGPDASPYAYVDSRYAFLPPAKREQLSRVEQDYSEMQQEIYAEAGDIQLPSDREKLKLLRLEKERDLAAAMTPEEYEQYNLHSSPTAMNVRSRYGDAIQTEDDYKKIFALQKTYDDQYSSFRDLVMGGPLSQEAMAARRAADAKLQDDIKAALGPDNYAALQKASDTDYKALTSVAKRLNLPPQTADTVFESRDTYAAASQRINADTSLSAAVRRTQLATLATQATSDLAKTLGSEGAEAYAARANWIAMLKRGSAFSTNPKDATPGLVNVGSSIYSLPPPRPAAVAAPKN